MLLSKLKTEFISALKEEYPEQEINSFFFILTEAYAKISRLNLALNPQVEINTETADQFYAAQNRLLKHEPVQYIVGETEFFGLTLFVNEDVLIPRPETEELVQWILDDCEQEANLLRILDIGTGSGCIPVSLAKFLNNAKISALDISEKALSTARKNAKLHQVEVNLIQADILQQESLDEKFDIIVSNPPYVRELEKQQMQRNVLEHEPHLALYVKDEDPLIFYRKITKLAKEGLNANGRLYFEINQYLGAETEIILKKEGFKTELRKDIYGNHRMLKGTL